MDVMTVGWDVDVLVAVGRGFDGDGTDGVGAKCMECSYTVVTHRCKTLMVT